MIFQKHTPKFPLNQYIENILYVFEHGIEVGFLRAFTAVPAHGIFGILMGYFMGKAKFSKNRFKNNYFGLLIATLFHGTYDFFLFLDFIPKISIFAITPLILGLIITKRVTNYHTLTN